MQFRGAAIALALVLTIAFGVRTSAQTIETNIITGPDGDAYARIGADIGELAGACGYQLSTQPSSGAFENLRAMRDRRATQLGLVNADVLEFFAIEQARDPEAARDKAKFHLEFAYQAFRDFKSQARLARNSELYSVLFRED